MNGLLFFIFFCLIFFEDRWTVKMLAESFNQSIDNVRLILRQRTTRTMRVRPRHPATLFGIKHDEERERLMREHIIKRDTGDYSNSDDDEDLIDCRVLAEESNLIRQQRSTDIYTKRDVSKKINY